MITQSPHKQGAVAQSYIDATTCSTEYHLRHAAAPVSAPAGG